MRALVDCEATLRNWKEQYAPSSPDDPWDDRFVEACNMLDYVSAMVDILFMPDAEMRKMLVRQMKEENTIQCLKERLEALREENEHGETEMGAGLKGCPLWFDGKNVNEAMFCQEFLTKHRLLYTENAFFTVNGRMVDETPLKSAIYNSVAPMVTNVSKKIVSIIELLKITAYKSNFKPQEDRINVTTARCIWTVRSEAKDQIVRSRFPVKYNPLAGSPERWLHFLGELLEPDDILTLQEFIGYCLIPSTAAQKMMVLKATAGRVKAKSGTVLARLFGCNAKDGSIGKVSENRFARADLEHILLMIDDDMRLEALKQTNYVKSIVTAQGRWIWKREGKQSYQGYLYARLQQLPTVTSRFMTRRWFFRRQLILTTKEKAPDRADDPHIADKLCTSWKPHLSLGL